MNTLSSLIQTVQVVEAVQSVLIADAKSRIPPELKGKVTFFTEHDLWLFQAILDERVCPRCVHHDGNIFPGLNLRFIWPYLKILNVNVIGGPGPGNTGLDHPNCRCRLHRLLPLELPEEPVPQEIQRELIKTVVLVEFSETLVTSEPLKKPLKQVITATGMANVLIYGLLLRNFIRRLALKGEVKELLKKYRRGEIKRGEVVARLEEILRETSDEEFIEEIKKMIRMMMETKTKYE